MSSWSSSDASSASVTLAAPEIQTGETLFSSTCGYSVLEILGEGCYGTITKCQNLETTETVAVKILKKDTDFIQDTEKEVSMLEVISVLDPDLTNVVKFFECFEHLGQTCLAFEMLDRNLYDLLAERDWKPLTLIEIRPIAKQLLVALDALRGLGILHTDIKPDNIMFVDMQDRPLRIKLIDFGEAILASQVQLGLEIQPCGYRAPEVALGLPFTEAIDVWGVGCILAFLFLAENLFPVNCNYQMMKCMVEVLGQPEDHLLRAGIYTQYFFREEEAADSPTWRLMTPEEYTAANNVQAEECNSFTELPSSLDDLVNMYPKDKAAEWEDRLAFVDLLKQKLHLDGDQRISPREALQQPFISMCHLTKLSDSRDYLTTSQLKISVCPVEDSADQVNTAETSEPDQESDTGFCDGTPATGSSDEVKPSDCYGNCSTGESDKDSWRSLYLTSASSMSVSSFNDEDTDPCSSDGLDLCSNDEDSASWSFDGLDHWASEEDSTTWSSNGLDLCSNDEDSASWSSDGLDHWASEEDSTTWSSNGLDLCSNDEDSASWSSDGLDHWASEEDSVTWSSNGLDIYSNDEDSAYWSSDGLDHWSSEEDSPTWSSDGATERDSTASASSSRSTKLLKRSQRFFSGIRATLCCCWSASVED